MTIPEKFVFTVQKIWNNLYEYPKSSIFYTLIILISLICGKYIFITSQIVFFLPIFLTLLFIFINSFYSNSIFKKKHIISLLIMITIYIFGLYVFFWKDEFYTIKKSNILYICFVHFIPLIMQMYILKFATKLKGKQFCVFMSNWILLICPIVIYITANIAGVASFFNHSSQILLSQVSNNLLNTAINYKIPFSTTIIYHLFISVFYQAILTLFIVAVAGTSPILLKDKKSNVSLIFIFIIFYIILFMLNIKLSIISNVYLTNFLK